jgi:hypothetical protein
MYQELKEAPIEIGLHINISKTKATIMLCSKINTDQCLILLGTILISHIMDDNNKLPEIQRRLILANNVHYSLITVMKIQ